MKQILALILCCCMMFAMAACAEKPAPTQPSTTAQTETTATTVPTTESTEPTIPLSTAVYKAPLACVSLPVITETEKNGTTTLSYYSYPGLSLVLPDADVAEVVKLDLMNRIGSTATAAQAIHEAAKRDYSNQSDWYNYYMDVSYGVERLDQNVLSLFGTESTFDGSPSSTTIGVSANYDLSTGTSLTLKSIMFPDFSADVLTDLIIEGLAEYDTASLLPGYEEVIEQMFSTNVPVESWYFSSTGLCFYFAPYEIAPQSMGIIYSHIPYTSLNGLMKEAYFPMDDLVYAGTVSISPLDELDSEVLESFEQFGELTIGEGGTKYLLTADGSVLNLRIYEATTDNAPGKTLHASAGMGPGNAVLLDLPSEITTLQVSFESNGETILTSFSVPTEQ